MDDARSRPEDVFAAASGCALAVGRVALTNFRSYASAELSVEPVPVVLTGPNGAGKTNLLEAISLLSPGRGLRGAKLAALQRKAPAERAGSERAFADALWAISASLLRGGDSWEIGTGLVPSEGPTARRTLHLNQAPADSADVAELVPMLWLTPAMDRLFLEGASDRRRFLDRLVFALDSGHARRMTRYERAMQQRLKLLRDGSRDRAWLDGLETSMAEDGAVVSATRLSLIETLNGELAARGAEGAFPCAHLALADALGASVTDASRLQEAFAASRERDADSGRTNYGPHLSDLEVRHTIKRADARDCSTGEQKALLISIMLANGWLHKKRCDGIAPILLLDEIAAHLDAKRRTALFEEILALGSQAWLTGTDANLFAPLVKRAAFFTVEAGRFIPGTAVM
jgi:DNA replication and repair protein RecF